jgi:predicted RNase H-like nuclease (RuvC/YqgF family)
MATDGLLKVVDDVNKLQQDVAVVSTLVDRLEDSVDKFDRQRELLHSRISSGEKEIKEKIDDQYDDLMKEMKEMRAESTLQHNELKSKVNRLERWMWTVVGGLTVLVFILEISGKIGLKFM